MKARMSIVAALAVIAAPALAQEAPKPPMNEPAPQTEQMPPATPPAAQPPAAQPPAAQPPATTDKQAAAPSSSSELVIGELREVQDNSKMVSALNAPVDRVEEMEVYDANGKKIAEVDSVLEDKNGEIKGIAIGYGGFLGFGEKGAVLTLDKIKEKNGNLAIDMTEDQLPSLPAWHR